MQPDYLHRHAQFPELIRIVAAERSIDPALVEKDYWIMHCLHGLQKAGFDFELKGGTSLSKGFLIIERFSEDLDIRINPPPGQSVRTGRNQTKEVHRQSRKAYYDYLARTIAIDDIHEIERDTAFDALPNYFSGGIRLHYTSHNPALEGLKEGVLLEAGFDDVTPSIQKDISSWMYDHAADKVSIVDNRAKNVRCYDYRYTFVEKLQTISTKFRLQQASGEFPANFMRHYYDVYQLLQREDVRKFTGTQRYKDHKAKRFRGGDNQNIAENQAFIMTDPATRKLYSNAYTRTSALYHGKKPTFEEILRLLRAWADRL
jgi:predicted nucleotidyltransferase component of viral defense system